jgi:dipeptidyl aminopeptidase/acylaminoacyl peptidase
MLSRVLLLAALVAGASSAVAQTPAAAPAATAAQPISIEEFVRLPAYSNPTVSRNGRYFAATIPINGRRNLAVVDMENRKGTGLTNFSDCDVAGVRWVGNDRLVFTLLQANAPTGPGQFECGGLFTVSREGKDFRRLSETVRDARRQNRNVYRGYSFLRTIPNNDEEILVTGNMRDIASTDIYRLNLLTGRATLVTETRPTRTGSWLLDRNRVPRVTTAWIKDTLTYVVYYRKDEASPFEEIARYEANKPGQFAPLAFEADNQIMHVSYDGGGRGTAAIYRYDPNARKFLDVLVEHPKFDMEAGSAITDPQTDELRGYRVEAERPQVVWLNETDKRLQNLVDGALPDRVNNITRIRGDQYLITSFSDRQPTTWYMLDDGKKTLEELFSSRPWLAGRMVEMRPFFLKTRDGLEILSYYFLPKNHKPGEKLPTIVHIHGGPSVRADFWGQQTFGVTEAQVLASRGYAVVLPNFRVTPGLGNKIFYGGFGTYGREMVNDHQDAANWAIQQGFADPKRICISGASYGGYATLMALARFPETFACGVAGLTVSDMPLILTSPAGDIPFNEAAVKFWQSIMGVKSLSDIPADISPVNLAARIKQPVMFYAGSDDIRTPLEQTTRMIRALERAGNAPRSVFIAPGEGHGFGKVEHNVKKYEEMLKFLESAIGPGGPR